MRNTQQAWRIFEDGIKSSTSQHLLLRLSTLIERTTKSVEYRAQAQHIIDTLRTRMNCLDITIAFADKFKAEGR